ncbi:MAG: hypothetical protein M5R37_14640 [Melioribacteraceae bacterium]|nr:hypothetical protein [Melioribacteraceae bacterium]
MKKITILFFTIILFVQTNLTAQTYEELTKLDDFSIDVYFSPGNEERTNIIANRCDSAIKYIKDLIGFEPEVSLLVLNPEHWKKYATFPVYGMPHYLGNKSLVVASDDNDFWRSFLPPSEQLPKELADRIKDTYSLDDGTISMKAFFDLLALHELGHGFHLQAGLKMQRLWMQEFFSNLLLHTYMAENEPENLPAVEVFTEMVVAAGSSEYQFTSLADFEKMYDSMDPKNYGWYQSKLTVAAKNVYNSGGKDILVKLWHALKNNQNEMNDEELAVMLRNEVHEEVAKILTDW